MSCKTCEENPVTTYYRWKNANIGLIGCKEHLREIIQALNLVQVRVKPHDQVVKEALDGKS